MADETPIIQEPAIGYSIVVGLSDTRQMTVNCFVGENEALAAIHAKVDKVMAVADRQRARYSLIEIEKDLKKLNTTLEHAESDFVAVEKRYGEQQLAFTKEHQEITRSITLLKETSAANRTGGPVGGDKMRLNQMNERLNEIDKAREARAGDKEQHREETLKSIGRFRETIAAKEAEAVELRAIIAS